MQRTRSKRARPTRTHASLRDLFNPKQKEKSLKIRESKLLGIYVDGLTMQARQGAGGLVGRFVGRLVGCSGGWGGCGLVGRVVGWSGGRLGVRLVGGVLDRVVGFRAVGWFVDRSFWWLV